MAPAILKRPILSIQPDWDEIFKEGIGTVWVSCKEYLKEGKHGKLNFVESDNASLPVRASDGFKVENINMNVVIVSHEDPNTKCIFVAAEKTFNSIHNKGVISMDVTPNRLGVSVCSANSLKIWDSSNGSILRHLEGHVFDVYTCRFFPSGAVVLSTGADMQIKIWSAETGRCAVTMTGHTAAITHTAIVERGRNILTVSKDGSARLWDCGESTCLDIVLKNAGSLNCCAIRNVNIDLKQPDNPPSEREVATGGKLLICGGEDNTFHGIGLQSRKSIFAYKCNSAINCCSFLSSSTVICGTQDGKIYLFDLTNSSEPNKTWEESASPVLCILPISNNGFFVGRADGMCIYTHLESDLMIQLTGPDFDSIYCLSHDGMSIFSGARDGCIRRYSLSNVPGLPFPLL